LAPEVLVCVAMMEKLLSAIRIKILGEGNPTKQPKRTNKI
jgi:hypothetical protein